MDDVPRFQTQRRMLGLRLGRYMLGRRLGAGGTASVHLARLAGPGNFERLVALKIIHEHLLDEGDFVRMFIDEANLAVRMAHPNVVSVFEMGREGDTLFLAMEYLHGQPLSRLIERGAELGVQLPGHLVAWIGARVAEGLHHAHVLVDDEGKPLGLVHRDVSPQNVFVTYDGQVKLIDFGIARAAGRLARTTLGRIKGKFTYMAPEQVLGRDFDHRADLFALGATLYEAALGVRPFQAQDETESLHRLLFEGFPDPRNIQPDFPEGLANVLHHAMASEPADRYASAAEIARDLDVWRDGVGAADPRDALTETMGRLFEEERAAQNLAIEELRQAHALSQGLDASPTETRVTDPTPNHAGSTTIRVPPRRSRATMTLAAVALGLAVGLGVLLLVRRTPGPVAVLGSDPLAAIMLDIKLQPPVDAVIEVAGTVIPERPARVSLPRGLAPVDITVRATGFEPTRLQAIPDRDQVIVVPLIRESAGAASARQGDASDTADAGPPSPSATQGVPRDGGTQPVKPRRPDAGGIITEYPD